MLSRLRKAWPAALVAALALWLLFALWLRVPTVQRLEGWFWPLGDGKLLPSLLLGVALFSFPLVIRRIAHVDGPKSHQRGLVLLLCLGFAYHHGLALLEHRGLDKMQERIELTGHGEFAATAARRLSVWHTLVDYEHFVQAPEQRYARSKPPGQLLFYFAAAAVARQVMPLVWDPKPPQDMSLRHFRLIHFATLFFPAIGLLTLIPLAYLGRVFLGERLALWPALLYLTLPGPALIQLHLDQVLYPLTATTFWACCAVAARSPRGEIKAWVWCAVVAWLGCFVSFSLLPMLLVGLGIVLGLALPRAREDWLRLARGLGVSLAAGLGLSLLAFVTIHYEPWAAYRRCMDNHQEWKQWRESLRWQWAKLDLIEFAYWLGIPTVALWLGAAFPSTRQSGAPAPEHASRAAVAARWFGGDAGLARITLLTVLLAAALGKTEGEVARLWLFLVPAVCVGVTGALARLELGSAEARLTALSACGLVWTYSLRAVQDFY